MDVQVAQDFLTDAEVERLRETEKLAEEVPEEEPLRARAWKDLKEWGVTDLETLIQLSEKRRRELGDKYSEAYRNHTPSTRAKWENDATKEEEMRRIAKWRASESATKFYHTTLPLDAKMVRLRVRGEVAEELLERHLLGYDIPETHPENPIVTPLSEYDPSPSAKRILLKVADLDREHDGFAEEEIGDVWDDLEEEVNVNARANLRQDMRGREKAPDRYPETTEEFVEIAREIEARTRREPPDERSQTFAEETNRSR